MPQLFRGIVPGVSSNTVLQIAGGTEVDASWMNVADEDVRGTSSSSNLIYYWDNQSTGQTTAITDYTRAYANYYANVHYVLQAQQSFNAANQQGLGLQNLGLPNLSQGPRQPETPIPRRLASHVVANSRARRLLLAHLTPEQAKTFESDGYFDVLHHPHDIAFYRIFTGRMANVIRYMRRLGEHNYRPEVALCCHPESYVPDTDVMLAQKFMLETDETGFLRLANRHPLPYGLPTAA